MKAVLFIAMVLTLANVAYASDACAFTVVSDTTNMVGDHSAAAAWTHTAWASIPDATWIWDTTEVATPAVDETYTFTKTFTASGVHTATLEIAADNAYAVKINGVPAVSDLSENNYNPADVYDVTNYIRSGENTIEITVTNIGNPQYDAHGNPAGVVYKLSLDSCPVDVPEFGTIAAGLVLVAGIGLVVMRRR